MRADVLIAAAFVAPWLLTTTTILVSFCEWWRLQPHWLVTVDGVPSDTRPVGVWIDVPPVRADRWSRVVAVAETEWCTVRVEILVRDDSGAGANGGTVGLRSPARRTYVDWMFAESSASAVACPASNHGIRITSPKPWSYWDRPSVAGVLWRNPRIPANYPPVDRY